VAEGGEGCDSFPCQIKPIQLLSFFAWTSSV